jgi:cell division protein FtsB
MTQLDSIVERFGASGGFHLPSSALRDSPFFAMGAKRNIGLIRRAIWPALALLIVGNFAGYAIAGPNGLMAWGGYHRNLEARQAELAQLKQQKAELQHRSALLDPRHADPDLADEMARSELGLVRPDEVVVTLK